MITEPALRLDRSGDRQRLLATATDLRPRLVLLDPLVRLHAANENDATQIAQLLSYFRDLQRRLDTAVVLVHHTRKHAAGGVPAGHSLRGSGDFWAFGDSNLYLRRAHDQVILSMEHRAAATPPAVRLTLVTTDQETVHFEVTGAVEDQQGQRDRQLSEMLLAALEDQAVMTRGQLRERLAIKNERLGRVLVRLENQGAIERTAHGWRQAAP